MQQYLGIKERYPDGVVFFRLGDFYEMFFDDAVITANALDLTLTTRDKGKEDSVPMCGVPHHAARGYIAKMTELGHKVILVEQVEDPKQAKGLVKRDVVRIITPGVVLDDEVLDARAGRYVATAVRDKGVFALAYIDVSTGELRATECASVEELHGQLARANPREFLATEAEYGTRGLGAVVLKRHLGVARTTIEVVGDADELLATHLPAVVNDSRATRVIRHALARLVAYARKTQPRGALTLADPDIYGSDDNVVLDSTAVQDLELVENTRERKRAGSLIDVIDKTCTAPGARMLRKWLLFPLTDLAKIRRRQDAVEMLHRQPALRDDIRKSLREISDIQRLTMRVSLEAATPRDLGKLRDSLLAVPGVFQQIDDVAGKLDLPALFSVPPKILKRARKLYKELTGALLDELPVVTKDGGLVRDGYCSVVDDNRTLTKGAQESLLAIESREQERTGIAKLRVKYNRVFGYYIEVTKSQLSKVPDDYVRKQTVANGERFVTGELAELEAKILSAQDVLVARELEIFGILQKVVVDNAHVLLALAERVAAVDCCAGLAEVAHLQGYVRPQVEQDGELAITAGRHPVVEALVERGSFVPNDCTLGGDGRRFLLITGPNMAGKSTYMRQVAQITLLAQIGSFVPAQAATIGLVDRILTRVGAADNLARGESTFMVEMREAAAILKNATSRSLVVLDEIGRGTSTYDGLSIAWALAEYLHDVTGCRALFATHYHEMTRLAEEKGHMASVSVAAKERDGTIVFLRQIVEGAANRSYGIDVARLAGLPEEVLERAGEILAKLEGSSAEGSIQLALFNMPGSPLKRRKVKSRPVATNIDGLVSSGCGDDGDATASALARALAGWNDTQDPKALRRAVFSALAHLDDESL